MSTHASEPRDPGDFPRRILSMVTGRTPQVVTETIYALCLRQDPPFVPTEVRLITTAEGAEDARPSLLSEDPGWFHALRRDYGLPEMAFSSSHIEDEHATTVDPAPGNVRDMEELSAWDEAQVAADPASRAFAETNRRRLFGAFAESRIVDVGVLAGRGTTKHAKGAKTRIGKNVLKNQNSHRARMIFVCFVYFVVRKS